MFVCHDKRWHIRNPTQCQVVEGIMHVCLYVMIKSGTIDIQHITGWWRASFMHLRMMYVTDKKSIEIILHVKQINSYLVAPMYL